MDRGAIVMDNNYFTPPEDAVDTPISIIWIRGDVIFSLLKEGYDPDSVEANKKTFDAMQKLAGKSKVGLIAETTHLKQGSKEVRRYASRRMVELFYATAYITPNVFSKMVMTAFLTLANPPYPVKFFLKTEEALKWLEKQREQ